MSDTTIPDAKNREDTGNPDNPPVCTINGLFLHRDGDELTVSTIAPDESDPRASPLRLEEGAAIILYRVLDDLLHRKLDDLLHETTEETHRE